MTAAILGAQGHWYVSYYGGSNKFLWKDSSLWEDIVEFETATPFLMRDAAKRKFSLG